MILSDRDLLAHIKGGVFIVDPFDERALQSCSIDLRIADNLQVWRGDETGVNVVDLLEDQRSAWWPCLKTEVGRRAEQHGPYWTLFPDRFYLATTLETVTVPDDLVGYLHGKSTLARMGVTPHQQAGLLDPGYTGRPTLEIRVALPTVLRPGDWIGHVVFEQLTSRTDRPYRGRYQGDTVPTPARRPKE